MKINKMGVPKIVGFVSENNTIVFIYRKKSKENYLIHLKYSKQKENFTLGSTFFGTFYPNRCDISSDGKHFIYFVMGKSQKKYEQVFSCWTAICSPPSITAQFFVGQNNTWGGGGKFIDKRTLFVDSIEIKAKKFREYTIIKDKVLEDNGWGIGKEWKLTEKFSEVDKKLYPKFWEKSNGKITIRRKLELDEISIKRGGFDPYSYTVIHNKTKQEIALEGCTWADFDNLERVVASNGSCVLFYKNYKEIEEKSCSTIHDLEELLVNE